MLAPVVIGFFEFIFMRSRQDLPLAQLARLFEEYMMHDDRFAHSVFEGNTQLGRALVKEEALPDENYSEILVGPDLSISRTIGSGEKPIG